MGAGLLRLQPREAVTTAQEPAGHSPRPVPGAPPHLLPEAEGLEGRGEGRRPPLTTLLTEKNTAPPAVGGARPLTVALRVSGNSCTPAPTTSPAHK